VRQLQTGHGIRTVCEGALCPNRPECYSSGHLTVLILGASCTRHCGFCSVGHGRPESVDPEEPRRVAEAVTRLGMRHVVITSVTRDDLEDGGASQYAAVAEAIQSLARPPTSEALIPDFGGDPEAVEAVARAPYRVLAHNVETVPRLYTAVRPEARYDRSLGVLSAFRRAAPAKAVKSGLMLGLGERPAEVRAVMADLRDAGVDALTLGQYLRPTPAELPVDRYVEPEEFESLAQEARRLGFRFVSSGIFVRSSYRAAECLAAIDPDPGAC
jgi:lipoic acid synthetase